ncbi:MAG TPA: sigma-70 family RNA polymerase sigma factor [Terriglobales bacterium]|nr:sigma-70 family RNA polymerase sigma factor [Terriglobales bacterium]
MPVLEGQSDVARQFALGDLEAFETLFRQYQSEVYRWTVRIVRDPGAAEDLTIETFWRIYRAHARFDPGRSFGAWARRIATNAALDYLKTRRVEVELPADFPATASPDPQIRRELQEQIRAAFHKLPAKLQITATLALVEELPYKEISDALGISVGAVKLRVFRALRQLRKNLKHLGVEP